MAERPITGTPAPELDEVDGPTRIEIDVEALRRVPAGTHPVIDLTGPEPQVTYRPGVLGDLQAAVDGRTRDGRWGLVLLLAVLQVVDVATTHLVLGVGGVEGNPLMTTLVSGGWAGPLVLKLAAVGLIACLVGRCSPTSALVPRALTAVVGVYTAIVMWNTAIYLASA